MSFAAFDRCVFTVWNPRSDRVRYYRAATLMNGPDRICGGCKWAGQVTTAALPSEKNRDVLRDDRQRTGRKHSLRVRSGARHRPDKTPA